MCSEAQKNLKDYVKRKRNSLTYSIYWSRIAAIRFFAIR